MSVTRHYFVTVYNTSNIWTMSRGSLVAKNRRSIIVAISTICLARINRCSACTAALLSDHPLCFALCTRWHRCWLTNPTAISTQCSLMHATRTSCGGKYGEYTRPYTRMVAPTITYNGESTRQGSVPFAWGSDMLVAAVSLPVPRCGVGKYYVGQKPS